MFCLQQVGKSSFRHELSSSHGTWTAARERERERERGCNPYCAHWGGGGGGAHPLNKKDDRNFTMLICCYALPNFWRKRFGPLERNCFQLPRVTLHQLVWLKLIYRRSFLLHNVEIRTGPKIIIIYNINNSVKRAASSSFTGFETTTRTRT